MPRKPMLLDKKLNIIRFIKKRLVKKSEIQRYNVSKYNKLDVNNYILRLENNLGLVQQNISLKDHFKRYGANYDYMNRNPDIQNYSPSINNIQNQPQPNFLTEDQEMELFGIENNCIRVVKDYMSGGYECDDFD